MGFLRARTERTHRRQREGERERDGTQERARSSSVQELARRNWWHLHVISLVALQAKTDVRIVVGSTFDKEVLLPHSPRSKHGPSSRHGRP